MTFQIAPPQRRIAHTVRYLVECVHPGTSPQGREVIALHQYDERARHRIVLIDKNTIRVGDWAGYETHAQLKTEAYRCISFTEYFGEEMLVSRSLPVMS